jgi:phytoene dehydrogenase-like protein
VLSAAAGVLTCVHDPGELSAAFVWERMRRNATANPPARYPIGGWTSLVDALEALAVRSGVRIATGSRVAELPVDRGPVVVAVEQGAARRLFGDDGLRWHGARTALLDVGLTARRGDPFVVLDLDDAAWAERFTAQDPSLAPPGHSLVQAHVGLRPGEELDDGIARIEALLDAAYEGWRTREAWRRRAGVDGDSGAVDPPGTTWRDRPAVDRGDGVWLAGDWVAAPGFYSEVSWASGVEAGRAAGAAARGVTRRASSSLSSSPSSP